MCRGDITEDEGNEGADQLKRKSLFIVVKTIRSESEHWVLSERARTRRPFLCRSVSTQPGGCIIVTICVSFTCIRCVFCNMCVMFVCPYMCIYCVADYKRGFGGKYGVEVERQDQCALGYEHKENLAKHESQKGTDTFLSTSPNPTLPFTKLLLILPFLWKVLPLSFFGWLWQKPLPLPQWHAHLCSTDWDF